MTTALSPNSIEDVSYAPYSRPPAKASKLPGILLLVAGTGGIFANENINTISGWVTQRVFENKRPDQTLAADARSVKDHLLNIRTVFHLNMTELAQVFGVTRPAAYGWLEGVEPKPDPRVLILKLSGAADQLTKAGIERPELYVRRPMFGGRSLVDFLKTGQEIVGAIAAIESIAKKEAAIRKEAPTRHAGRSKRQLESLDTLANPLIRDRA